MRRQSARTTTTTTTTSTAATNNSYELSYWGVDSAPQLYIGDDCYITVVPYGEDQWDLILTGQNASKIAYSRAHLSASIVWLVGLVSDEAMVFVMGEIKADEENEIKCFINEVLEYTSDFRVHTWEYMTEE